MPIELAITDETPDAACAPQLADEELLDCFLGAPLNGSYRQYLLAAGRAIEAKVRGTDGVPACRKCGAKRGERCAGDWTTCEGSAAHLERTAGVMVVAPTSFTPEWTDADERLHANRVYWRTAGVQGVDKPVTGEA